MDSVPFSSGCDTVTIGRVSGIVVEHSQNLHCDGRPGRLATSNVDLSDFTIERSAFPTPRASYG